MSHNHNRKKHFDFATVFANTKRYIDRYNAKCTRLTDKINANQRATAELIIRLYLKQLNGSAELDLLSLQKLPGFATYNESLAKNKGCTKRTIINHRQRLVYAGLIIREEQKGSGGVEIWINPEVLGAVEQSTYLGAGEIKTGALSTFFSEVAKNFHPLVHEQQEQENINSSVDNSTVHSQGSIIAKQQEDLSGVRSAHSHGLPRPNCRGEATGTRHEHHKNTEENVAPVSKKEHCAAKKQEQLTGGAGRIFLLTLVRQFWEYAKRSLYPSIILSDPEEREILNLIWDSVYGKFRLKISEKEWLAYHETAITRMDIVKRWLSRSHTHWIPRPHLYFHPNNDRNGFKKTWDWYVRQETLKTEVRNQLALQQAQLELNQHNQGKGRYRHKTRLQLFRIHEKRLSRYKDADLLQVYQECLQRRLHLQKIKDHAF